MSELNDNPELQKYSSAVLQVMSAVYLPATFAEAVLEKLVEAIQLSKVCEVVLTCISRYNGTHTVLAHPATYIASTGDVFLS